MSDYFVTTEPKTSEEWTALSNKRSIAFTSDTQMSVQRLDGPVNSQLIIIDVSNAFKTGAECMGYSLHTEEPEGIYDLLVDCAFNVQEIMSRCNALFDDVPDNEYAGKTMEINGHTISVYDRTEKGVRVFSPLPQAKAALKPLKEVPKKWNMRHICRALANGQLAQLQTRNRYTDDYAYDNACNFGKGDLHPDTLLETLTESPSGWRINHGTTDGSEMGINCYHFESKSCIVDLKKQYGKDSLKQAV